MRKINRRSAEKSIAVIIDGKDEKWYLETVKEHYPNADMKKATIKPDLPQKKSVEALFALAQQKLAMESTQVILILDMDCIIKNSQEFEHFKVYYEKYLKSTQGTLTPREKAKYGWMNNLVIIVNTPCLEFWYLLHFSKTHKFFPDFSAMEATLGWKNMTKAKTTTRNRPTSTTDWAEKRASGWHVTMLCLFHWLKLSQQAYLK